MDKGEQKRHHLDTKAHNRLGECQLGNPEEHAKLYRWPSDYNMQRQAAITIRKNKLRLIYAKILCRNPVYRKDCHSILFYSTIHQSSITTIYFRFKKPRIVASKELWYCYIVCSHLICLTNKRQKRYQIFLRLLTNTAYSWYTMNIVNLCGSYFE